MIFGDFTNAQHKQIETNGSNEFFANFHLKLSEIGVKRKNGESTPTNSTPPTPIKKVVQVISFCFFIEVYKLCLSYRSCFRWKAASRTSSCVAQSICCWSLQTALSGPGAVIDMGSVDSGIGRLSRTSRFVLCFIKDYKRFMKLCKCSSGCLKLPRKFSICQAASFTQLQSTRKAICSLGDGMFGDSWGMAIDRPKTNWCLRKSTGWRESWILAKLRTNSYWYFSYSSKYLMLIKVIVVWRSCQINA